MLEIELKLLEECNLRCKHCYALSRPYNGNISYSIYHQRDYLESFSHKILEFSIFYSEKVNRRDLLFVVISLMGGEPLLIGRERIEMVMDTLQDKFERKGIKTKFTISTNALLINKEWLEFFKKNEDRLSVAYAYDFDIRFNSSYEEERWRENFRLSQEFGLDITVNIVVTANLINTDVWKFVEKANIKKVDISPFLPVGRGRFYSDALGTKCSVLSNFYVKLLKNKPPSVRFETMESVRDKLRIFMEKVNDQYWLNGWGPCWNKIVFDMKGSVYLECTYPEVLGNVFNDSFEKIALSEKLINLYKNKLYRKKCVDCIFWKFCRGGCVVLTCYEDEECRGLKNLLRYLYEENA